MQTEQQKEKIKNKWGQVKADLEQYQISILHIVGHPEGEKNEKCVENSFKEIIAKSLPKLWKKIDV